MMVFLGYLCGYLSITLLAGVALASILWIVVAITVDTARWLPLAKTALISQAVGNLPALAGMGATTAPRHDYPVIGAGLWIYLLFGEDELAPLHTVYGVCMTYFIVAAAASCSLI